MRQEADEALARSKLQWSGLPEGWQKGVHLRVGAEATTKSNGSGGSHLRRHAFSNNSQSGIGEQHEPHGAEQANFRLPYEKLMPK